MRLALANSLNAHRAPPVGGPLSGILAGLGLTDGLKLALDAGDINSWPGTGQTWFDTSGNDTDFYLGADGNAGANDPTFNGTAGGLSASEFVGFDGGDYFTRAAANDAWMQNLHKDNAKAWGAAWVWLGSAAVCGIFGLNGGNAAQVGFSWIFEATPRHTLYVLNGSGSAALNQSFAGGLVTGAWQFVAFSIDESIGAGGITFITNSTVGTRTSTYASPSSGNATYTAQIGARGNNAGPLVNSSRKRMICVGEGVAPTSAQLLALRAATRGMVGV